MGPVRPDELPEEAELRRVFVEQVKARLSEKNKSLNWLADFAGVNRGYLSQVLREQKVPSISIVARLAVALQCEPWELLRKRSSR